MIRYTALAMMFFFIVRPVLGQNDKAHYQNICGTIRKNNSRGKDALDVKASNFLHANEVYIYFYIAKSDTLSLFLNDSLIKKSFINVFSDRTGDSPDYLIKFNVKSKMDTLTLYFDNDKSFFKIPIKRKYKVYGIAYKTGVWKDCIYVEMRKYYRFQ